MNAQATESLNEPDLRRALVHGFDVGNRYAIVSNYKGNRGLNGTMFRSQAGSSMEFLEHRDYQPGDDLRHIDWKVMAKRDQAYLKCFEQESTPVLDIVLDHSQSMRLVDEHGQAESSKAAGSLKLLAALVAAANNSHFHTKIWTAGSASSQLAGLSSSEGGCHLLPTPASHPDSWPLPDFSSTQFLSDAFQERPPKFRPNGYRILISDLLFDADPFPVVQQLVERSQRSVIIQVLSKSDVTPPEHGSIRVVDSETGETQTVYIDSQLQAQYKESLENHQARWNESASRNGCLFIPLIAESIVQRSDLRELEECQVLVGSNRTGV